MFTRVFSEINKPLKSSPSINEETIRNIVAKYARGNINLQFGRYSTTEQIDKRREAVCQFKYVD